MSVHEVFVRGTVNKSQLLEMSENDVELLANIFPWTPVELGKQYLILQMLSDIDRYWDRNIIRIWRFRNNKLLRTI